MKGSPCFFVENLDFEIAVFQQTKAHDQTFETVSDSGCPPVPTGQPRPDLVNFWLNFAMLWGALLVATSPEHIYKVLSKLDKNYIPIYGHMQ